MTDTVVNIITALGGAGIGSLLTKLFEIRKAKAEAGKVETEINSLEIDNEVKLADAWRDQYLMLKKELEELRILYGDMEDRTRKLVEELERKDLELKKLGNGNSKR